MAARTIGALWRDAVARASARPAYLAERDGDWVEVSWPEAARRVDELANGLLALGISKGDAFAILASTSLEWCLFDFALGLIGAIGAPIYANSSPHDVAYVLEPLRGGRRARRGRGAAGQGRGCGRAPRLRPRAHVRRPARARGARPRACRRTPGARSTRRVAAVGEDDLFTYIYTSGTTGPPKACMIRHRNYYDDGGDGRHRMPGLRRGRTTRCSSTCRSPTTTGGCSTSARRTSATRSRSAAIRSRRRGAPRRPPDALPERAARLREGAHRRRLAARDDASGPSARLGRLGAPRRTRGEPPAPGRTAAAARARAPPPARRPARLLEGEEALGGRLRVANSGGAPLSPRGAASSSTRSTSSILEGYGLTECTTAVLREPPRPLPLRHRRPARCPAFEVRLADDGELLIAQRDRVRRLPRRTRRRPARCSSTTAGCAPATSAEIDEDGFITITDRKKDILVTAGGKNVAPQNLENELKASKYVSQALVVGDRRPYVAALITLDRRRDREVAGDGGTDVERARPGASSTSVNRAPLDGSSRSSASRSCRATSPPRRARSHRR